MRQITVDDPAHNRSTAAGMLLKRLPFANGVKVGNLFYKGERIADALTRCVRLVLMEQQIEGLAANQSLGHRGSSTLISYEGEKWVVLTRHQLGMSAGDPVKLSILDQVRNSSSKENRVSNIQTDRCIFEELNLDEEYHDLIALHVADQTESTNRDSCAFMPLLSEGERRRRLVSVAVGCPSSSIDMDYDGDHITTRTAIFDCKANAEYTTNNAYLQQFSYTPPEREVDGLSGGAIFSLTDGSNGLEFLLDGVILRAGGGFIHSIAASYLRQLTDDLPTNRQ